MYVEYDFWQTLGDLMFNQTNDLIPIENWLRQAFYRASCPSPEQWLEHSQNLSNVGAKARLNQHLQQCPHCAREWAELVLAEMPASDWWERLQQWIGQLIAVKDWLPTQPLVWATSQPTGFAMGLKGEGDWSWVYQTEGYRLTLVVPALSPTLSNYSLEGSLLSLTEPDQENAGTVYLYQNNQPIHQTPLDPFGFFTFHSLTLGQYLLAIQLPTQTICLPEVILPPNGSPNSV